MPRRIVKRTSISERRVVTRRVDEANGMSMTGEKYRVLVFTEDDAGQTKVFESGPLGEVSIDESDGGELKLIARK